MAATEPGGGRGLRVIEFRHVGASWLWCEPWSASWTRDIENIESATEACGSPGCHHRAFSLARAFRLAACSARDQALYWPPPSADGGRGAAKPSGSS